VRGTYLGDPCTKLYISVGVATEETQLADCTEPDTLFNIMLKDE